MNDFLPCDAYVNDVKSKWENAVIKFTIQNDTGIWTVLTDDPSVNKFAEALSEETFPYEAWRTASINPYVIGGGGYMN